MPAKPDPQTPMFRVAYTKLTEGQIASALAKVAKAGPACASPLSDSLRGKSLRIVTDKGPTLSYRFASDRQLSVSENGGKAVDAGYGALVQDHITLIAHLIPNSLRGYAVVIDNRTNIATVFDLWFGGFVDKREVMREIYPGYVDTGKPEPVKRHKLSNRAEGKGFYWKQDTGYETLEYYPSAAYSHFVELTGTGNEMGFSAPSDYLQIDDEFYIYDRWEAEFSGTFTLYVMDLNRQEQIGLRLGFDRLDALDYYLFRGKGEWLGQIAQFEKFGDTNGAVLPLPENAKKGERRVYRPVRTYPKMTREQVAEAVAKNRRVFAPRVGAGSGASGMAVNGTPPVDVLAGKTFTIRYDGGPVMEYRVASADTLSWRKDGGAWKEARYQAWESMPGVVLFGHLLEGEPNHDGHMIVADFDAGLASCFNGYLNTPYFAQEAGARTLFGVLEGQGIPSPGSQRHQRTRELLGRALTWNYAPGLTSMHLYSTPNTVSWIIFTDSGAGGMEWSGSGDFVKIRDGLYFAYWLEEACNGTLGTILINMRTMHDAGIGYHCGEEGLSMSQIGAHARHAGQFDVARFFAKKEA
ncbi:MAG: MoaF N-terminal domain-containing protein [Sphingomonadales bacterium]|nr:MoaF N-terminal domain-containing protein [Sphingomonadales bacterium]